MSNELAISDNIALSLVQGDISKLTPAEIVAYYRAVCAQVGVDPALKPFDLIRLNGRLVMYANKGCAEQLRRINGVSVIDLQTRVEGGLFFVTVKLQDKNGRTDMGTVPQSIAGLKGDALINAMLKCETKAKRRVTLSLCGLGMLDEAETETIPNAQPVNVNVVTGEVIDAKAEPPPQQASDATLDMVTIARARMTEMGWKKPQFDKMCREVFGESYKSLADAAKVVASEDLAVFCDRVGVLYHEWQESMEGGAK